MKARTIFFIIVFGLIALTVKGQTLNLADLIQCHKKSCQELTEFLTLKSRIWYYKGHDVDYTWWSFDNGSLATLIKKTDGDFDQSVITLVTNNKDIPRTILADVETNKMIKDGAKLAYIGKIYVVIFDWAKNDNGEPVYSIHLVPKKLYYNAQK